MPSNKLGLILLILNFRAIGASFCKVYRLIRLKVIIHTELIYIDEDDLLKPQKRLSMMSKQEFLDQKSL